MSATLERRYHCETLKACLNDVKTAAALPGGRIPTFYTRIGATRSSSPGDRVWDGTGDVATPFGLGDGSGQLRPVLTNP